MKDKNSEVFISALKKNDIELVKKIPKGEFHNHSALGVDRKVLEKFGVKIPEFEEVNSIEEMDIFSRKYVSKLTKTEEGFKFLIEGTVISAINDGVVVLETSIDFRFFKFYNDRIEQGISYLQNLRKKYINRIILKYDIGLSRKSYDDKFQKLIIELIDSNIFSGIDLYGDEKYNELSKFKKVYEYGKSKNLKLKAHIGEFGTENDIINTIEYLGLNVVQHGISIINSKYAIKYAKEKKIIFNVCPSSNVLLRRIENIKEHPIKLMYENGLKVTINTDDLLLFNSTISNEYLKLYKNNVLTAEELDEIRIESLIY